MSGCGPRGPCRPLDEKQGFEQTNRASHPVRVAARIKGAASSCEGVDVSCPCPVGEPLQIVKGWGVLSCCSEKPQMRLFRFREIGYGAWNRTHPRPDQKNLNGWRCAGLLLTANRHIIGSASSLQSSYTWEFEHPHRSNETLGRGPRSDPRAPISMVGGSVGSFGFVGWRASVVYDSFKD